MDKTEHLELNQWESTDRIMMEDFNNDNAKIDAALGEMAGYGTSIAQHAAAIARLGNCQVYTTSYVGNGSSGQSSPNFLYFPHPPRLLLIFSSTGSQLLLGLPAARIALYFSTGTKTFSAFTNITASGNTVSWYASSYSAQLNASGTTYQVLALLDAAQ